MIILIKTMFCFLVNRKNCIFALPRWEKSAWSEKAHFSLYSLTVNLDNSLEKKEYWERRFSLLCLCMLLHNIQRSDAISFFSFHGSPDPTVRNKGTMGGSALSEVK